MIEPIDERVLSDPEREIIAPGGVVLFALKGDDVVGTCALKAHRAAAGSFELVKMAVTPAAQGCGVGRLLIDAAVADFVALGGQELFWNRTPSSRPHYDCTSARALSASLNCGAARSTPARTPT